MRIDDLELRQESFSLHQNLLTSAAVSYISEMAEVFVREKEADPPYYRLLGATLDGLHQGVDPDLLLRYFEFWTARLHGIFPSLEGCDTCGRAFDDSGAWMAVQGEAALCSGCNRTAGGRSLPLRGEALALLEVFRRAAPTEFSDVGYSGGAIREVESVVGLVLIGFTGREFKSAPFLKQVLAEKNR